MSPSRSQPPDPPAGDPQGKRLKPAAPPTDAQSNPEPSVSASPKDKDPLGTIPPLPPSGPSPAASGSAWELAETDPFELSWVDRVHRHRNPVSSVLVSFIVHLVLFLALVLLARWLPLEDRARNVAILTVEPTLESPELQDETLAITLPVEAESPMENRFEETAQDGRLEAAALEILTVAPPGENSPLTEATPAPTGQLATAPSGGGLKGRLAENRARLAAARGATEASEAAVERGLLWLINHQQANGAWVLNLNGFPCDGRCRDAGKIESQNAATGLALMAFLGAGYTHREGPYQDHVGRGLEYLKARMRVSRFGGSLVDDSMYAHGIATIALAEAYHMTGDESLREPVSLAVAFIAAAQHPRGGWRYQPGQPGDMTVTGWQMMALKSAQLAGIAVPEETLTKGTAFLDAFGDSGGAYYGYEAPGKLPAPTAIGLLLRMYLGAPRNDGRLAQGSDWLVEQGPSTTNVYYNYYATQVLHHLSHESWPAWNRRLRDHLVQTQSNRGHETGSWHFPDQHGSAGGRLYTTAMSIMILEVYYRYLPLYAKDAID